MSTQQYKGPTAVESYLYKKKRNERAHHKTTYRYFKFDLNHKSFSYKMSKDTPEIKIIHNGKHISGFEDKLSSEDRSPADKENGFKILTINRAYILFAENKETYIKWMRILNLHFNKLDILNVLAKYPGPNIDNEASVSKLTLKRQDEPKSLLTSTITTNCTLFRPDLNSKNKTFEYVEDFLTEDFDVLDLKINTSTKIKVENLQKSNLNKQEYKENKQEVYDRSKKSAHEHLVKDLAKPTSNPFQRAPLDKTTIEHRSMNIVKNSETISTKNCLIRADQYSQTQVKKDHIRRSEFNTPYIIEKYIERSESSINTSDLNQPVHKIEADEIIFDDDFDHLQTNSVDMKDAIIATKNQEPTQSVKIIATVEEVNRYRRVPTRQKTQEIEQEKARNKSQVNITTKYEPFQHSNNIVKETLKASSTKKPVPLDMNIENHKESLKDLNGEWDQRNLNDKTKASDGLDIKLINRAKSSNKVKLEMLFDEPVLHIKKSIDNKKVNLENLHYGNSDISIASYQDLTTKVAGIARTGQKRYVKRSEQAIMDTNKQVRTDMGDYSVKKKIFNNERTGFTMNLIVPEPLLKSSDNIDRYKQVQQEAVEKSMNHNVYMGKSYIDNTVLKEETMIKDASFNIEGSREIMNNNERSVYQDLIMKMPNKKAETDFQNSRVGFAGLEFDHVRHDDHHTKISKTFKVEDTTFLGDDYHMPVSQVQQLKTKVLQNQNEQLLNDTTHKIETHQIETDQGEHFEMEDISRISRNISMLNIDECWDNSIIDDDFLMSKDPKYN